MSAEGVAKLVKRYDRLKSDRSSWEQHWGEVIDYLIPRKRDYIDPQTPGTKRMDKVMDSTPMRALDIMVSGLNSMLTSTTSQWFALRPQDIQLMGSHAVRVWLGEVQRRMYTAFNGSNWGPQMNEIYNDLATVGTGAMFVDEHPEKILRFLTTHVGECVIAENNEGTVDTLFRLCPWTLRQIAQQFGEEAMGRNLLDEMQGNPDKEVEVLHAVTPRSDRNSASESADNLPFASLYIEKKSQRVLSEGGFWEFPFVVPRWVKHTREIYGRSPGMTALPDIKMLYRMETTVIRAAEKAVDPPIMMPHDGVVGSIKLVPAGITHVRMDVIKNRFVPAPMVSGQKVEIGLELENQKRMQIERCFFTDLFLLLMDRPKMTATEVIERNEEKMALMSPILGRLMSEMLDPMIDRAFGIMFRGGYFPEPPPELMGQSLMVEYVSPLAIAQRQYEDRAIQRTVQRIAPMAQFQEQIMDNFDFDAIARMEAELMSFPQELLRTQEQVAEIRAARAEAKAAEQQKMELGQMVEGIAKLAPVMKLQREGATGAGMP